MSLPVAFEEGYVGPDRVGASSHFGSIQGAFS